MAEGEVRSFRVEDGEVAVLNPDGRVLRQAVPEGVSATAFRHILSSVDMWWGMHGVFPTPEQARTFWKKIPLSTYQAVFATDEFREALEKRGITADPDAGLTPQQATAIALLSNPEDRRSVASVLRDIGVPYTTFQNWMRQPLFSRTYKERVENLLQDSVPRAIKAITANVEAGDQRAAEFLLKMTGRYDPAAIEANNARVVVLRLLELIQAHAPKEAQEAILRGLDGTLASLKAQSALKEIS